MDKPITGHLPAGYQRQCHDWAFETVGARAACSSTERGVRFLEEAIELAQAVGVHGDIVMQLVRDVYERKPGRVSQEVGGTMLTLASLCEAIDVDMIDEAKRELERVQHPTVIAKVRARQATKLHQFTR